MLQNGEGAEMQGTGVGRLGLPYSPCAIIEVVLVRRAG